MNIYVAEKETIQIKSKLISRHAILLKHEIEFNPCRKENISMFSFKTKEL